MDFALLGCKLALDQRLLFAYQFLYFGMRMFTLYLSYHYILEAGPMSGFIGPQIERHFASESNSLNLTPT